MVNISLIRKHPVLLLSFMNLIYFQVIFLGFVIKTES